jgi:glycosyltransferase involved in cell wall biosynthesis
MKIVIDAHNIRAGGGLTHLSHILREASKYTQFESIHVYGGKQTFEFLEDIIKGIVTFKHEKFLDGNIIKRYFWMNNILPLRLKETNADVLFSPGGLLPMSIPKGIKVVTMNQNILPFIISEAKQDGIKLFIRRQLQKYLQLRSYKKAHGVIFLSEYARNIIGINTPDIIKKAIIIPHGVDIKFHKSIEKEVHVRDPEINLLYVSNIKSYKHQWNVVKAVSHLNQLGYNSLKLTLVGPADKKPLKRLYAAIDDNEMNDCVVWLGSIPYREIVKIYHSASIFVYASSCETFGQTVLEAMASRLPIACSNLGPMQEFAKDSAIYFNPSKPKEIAQAIKSIIDDPELSKRIATSAAELSKKYTWEECATQTFKYLKKEIY